MNKKDAQKTETRLIVFLDILGFKDILGKNNEGLDFLLDILREMRKFQQKFSVKIDEFKDGRKIKISSDLSAYSDHLIISIPIDEIPIEILTPWSLVGEELYIMQQMQKRNIALRCVYKLITYAYTLALSKGVALRGAISIGHIYYNEDERIFLGESLVEAINDEAKKAIYPRVIISDSLLRHFIDYPSDYNPSLNFMFTEQESMMSKKEPVLPYFIIKDHVDNHYYINWFHNILKDRKFILEHFSMLSSIRDKISENINSTNHKADVLSKWRWLASCFNKNLMKWNEFNPLDKIEKSC
jgi:hypothetical protein